MDESERNLTILAESLRAAQEREAAVDVYRRLDKVISNGEALIAIGNLLYLDNNISEAIEAINKGIKKGDLKNPGFAQLTLDSII